jgi:hypothetical protein
MNAEQITTIITNVLTGGGVAAFLYMVIRGLKDQIGALKTQIGTLNETIEVQKKTLQAMETRVLETEKVGNIYKRLTEELPGEIDKYRDLITKLKDDQITELTKANQDKDERLQKTAQIELEKLELQQQALEDIPGLRRELIEVVNTLQQRLSTVDQLATFGRPERMNMGAGSGKTVGLLSTVANALDAITVTGKSLKGVPIEYFRQAAGSDHPNSDDTDEQPKNIAY